VKRRVIRTVTATILERTPEPFSQQPPQRTVPRGSGAKDSRNPLSLKHKSIPQRESLCRR